MKNCIACSGTDLSAHKDTEEFSYKGGTVDVSLEFSVCNSCGREFVAKEQILRNEKLIRDKKKKFDGLLSSKNISETREKLSLTQEQASLVFGGGRNAFSKYERDEVAQSAAMDKLIRVAIKYPVVLRDLMRAAGVDSISSRVSSEKNVICYESAKASRKERYVQRSLVTKEEYRNG